MASLVERLDRELYAAATARPRDAARYAAVLERAVPGLTVASVRVAPFTAWCAEQGRQPDAEARAEYAAHLVAQGDPGVIAWPPGRNEPCWCGSGRKYKKCCAAPSSVEAGPPQ